MSLGLDVLASGSYANCALLRGGKTAILVDAGLVYSDTLNRLADIGFDPSDLDAICCTHSHGDHARGIPLLASRLGIPIYTTRGTLNAIKWGHVGFVKQIAINTAEPFDIGDLRCTAWSVPHDAKDPVAFSFGCDGEMATVAVDLGSIPEDLAIGMLASSIVMIEANYDEDLVPDSEYSARLKQRISGPNGHLSTQAACALLKTLDPQITRRVVVGHISKTNSRVELVRLMCRQALNEKIELEVIGDACTSSTSK